MAQYIDKAAVVAEIERYKHKADERLKMKNRTLSEDMKDLALQNLCGNLLHFIDTLEMKEVDLEKEIDIYYNFCPGSRDYIPIIAKHFFALGLKAKEEVTTTDALIDKACEWIGNYLMDLGYHDDWMRDSQTIPSGERLFRNAMKGE